MTKFLDSQFHVSLPTEDGLEEYDFDLYEHNRAAWNLESTRGSAWSTPVTRSVIDAARRGDWEIRLTPNKAVPRDWFGELSGRKVLALASGGGQQAPVLAAAGAQVTSYDLSEVQLQKDDTVARASGLAVRCVLGNMCDLDALLDEEFDLIVHPVSNIFAKDLDLVWSECFRVLKKGGSIVSGFMNPAYFLFDHDEAKQTGQLNVKHRLPFSDTSSLEPSRLGHKVKEQQPLYFGHTLESQIGGQIKAGFSITGFYEDWWSDEATPLNRFSPCSAATRATKPK